MHIADIECGILGANGIVGGGIPISVGVGFSCRMEGKKRVAVCFFGEGAVNNGVFHESLNMAAIFKLPVIFICENNLYAISTSVSDSSSGSSIWNKACAYNIPGIEADGMDVEDTYGKISNAASRARSGKGPTLVEARTYRFFGHHLQDAQAYRDKKESETYRNTMDPVINYRQKLVQDGIVDEALLEKMEEGLKKEIEDALKFAEESPLPDLKDYLESIKDL
jgi:TPP-dependent pyruvate/acetoin dehydrogenase alpha subunit